MKSPYLHIAILTAFLLNSLGLMPPAFAQDFSLPAPGVMVPLSPEFNPPILKGIKIHPDNPFRFDFILDKGDTPKGTDSNSALRPISGQELVSVPDIKQESAKLIKYFLASLTIPEKDLWVNLSPYEKDRIVPQSFGLTEMGRDLLAEDYMLKQITASLIYPESQIGKKFWKQVYEEAQKKYGRTDIAVNTFNKVWIVPQKAVVFENAKLGTAYVVEARLKVMLEEDYLSLEKHGNQNVSSPNALVGDLKNRFPTNTFGNVNKSISTLGSQIVREIVLPELNREVNEGKNFAQLRQVYNSLILANWYKKKIKDSILAQLYEDKNKIAGVSYEHSMGTDANFALRPISAQKLVSVPNNNDVEYIYQRYLQAFKKGVYNYIKEDVVLNSVTRSSAMAPRKYFSGGTSLTNVPLFFATADKVNEPNHPLSIIRVLEEPLGPGPNRFAIADGAMTAKGMIESVQEQIRKSKVRSLLESDEIFKLFNQEEGRYKVDQRLLLMIKKLDPRLSDLLDRFPGVCERDDFDETHLFQVEFNKVLRPYDLYAELLREGYYLLNISQRRRAVLINKLSGEKFEKQVLFAQDFGKHSFFSKARAYFSTSTKEIIVFSSLIEQSTKNQLRFIFDPSQDVAETYYYLNESPPPQEVLILYSLLDASKQRVIDSILTSTRQKLSEFETKYKINSLSLEQLLEEKKWADLFYSLPLLEAEALSALLDEIRPDIERVLEILKYAVPVLRGRINRALNDPVKQMMMEDLRQQLGDQAVEKLQNYYLLTHYYNRVGKLYEILQISLHRQNSKDNKVRLTIGLIRQSIINRQNNNLIPEYEEEIKKAMVEIKRLRKIVNFSQCQELINKVDLLKMNSIIGHELWHAYQDAKNISQKMERSDHENLAKGMQISLFDMLPRMEMIPEILRSLHLPENHHDDGRVDVLKYYADNRKSEQSLESLRTPEGIAAVIADLGRSERETRDFYAHYLADPKVWGEDAVDPNNFILEVIDDTPRSVRFKQVVFRAAGLQGDDRRQMMNRRWFLILAVSGAVGGVTLGIGTKFVEHLIEDMPDFRLTKKGVRCFITISARNIKKGNLVESILDRLKYKGATERVVGEAKRRLLIKYPQLSKGIIRPDTVLEVTDVYRWFYMSQTDSLSRPVLEFVIHLNGKTVIAKFRDGNLDQGKFTSGLNMDSPEGYGDAIVYVRVGGIPFKKDDNPPGSRPELRDIFHRYTQERFKIYKKLYVLEKSLLFHESTHALTADHIMPPQNNSAFKDRLKGIGFGVEQFYDQLPPDGQASVRMELAAFFGETMSVDPNYIMARYFSMSTYAIVPGSEFLEHVVAAKIYIAVLLGKILNQVGNQALKESLERFLNGKGSPDEFKALVEYILALPTPEIRGMVRQELKMDWIGMNDKIIDELLAIKIPGEDQAMTSPEPVYVDLNARHERLIGSVERIKEAIEKLKAMHWFEDLETARTLKSQWAARQGRLIEANKTGGQLTPGNPTTDKELADKDLPVIAQLCKPKDKVLQITQISQGHFWNGLLADHVLLRLGTKGRFYVLGDNEDRYKNLKGSTRFEYLKGKPFALPLTILPKSIDVVIFPIESGMNITHDREMRLQEELFEINRVLKPGGKIIIKGHPDAFLELQYYGQGILDGGRYEVNTINGVVNPYEWREFIKSDKALVSRATAQEDLGGIDLSSDKNLQVKSNDANGISFKMDAAMLARLQKAQGFVPVIINIQPMINLKEFLGI